MKHLALLPLFVALLALSPSAFAASVAVTINDVPYTGPSNPKGVRLVAGQPFTVDIKVTGGDVADPIWLKHGTDIHMNGASMPDPATFSFYLTVPGPGPVTIPGLDIAMANGPALHVDPIKLVVYPK